MEPGACESCGGSGFYDEVEYSVEGPMQHSTPDCLRCDGTGNEPTPERLAEIDAEIESNLLGTMLQGGK